MNTKEFARLCNTEKRTLFYYDEIGLLKPKNIKENGYRDYDLSQIQDMDNIKILQACGYTLFEIKDILESNDKKDYIKNGIRMLDKRIEELEGIKEYINIKQAILDEYNNNSNIKYYETAKLVFDMSPIDAPHFFSYINDGVDARSLLNIKSDTVYRLVLNDNGKYTLEGKALTGFISGSGSHITRGNDIRELFKGYKIKDEVVIVPVPHLLLEKDHFLMKVVAFIDE